MTEDPDRYGELRGATARLLAAAHAADENDVVAEVRHIDELLAAEMNREAEYVHLIEHLRRAIESRDVIGQAKGIIISSLRCSAEEAFVLLRDQSQQENRKLVEVAAEIVTRATSRAPSPRETPLKPSA